MRSCSATRPSGVFDRRAQRDRALGAAVRVLEVDQHLGVVVLALDAAAPARAGAAGRAAPRRTATRRSRSGRSPRAPKELPPAPNGAALAAAELEAGVPVRRRLELLAGLPVAAHLVVGGALLRVLQDLVGLVDLLEARLGVGHLADVGVVLAGELAVGLLDVVLRRAARDAERLVVVLVLHRHVGIPVNASGLAGTAAGAGATAPSQGSSASRSSPAG